MKKGSEGVKQLLYADSSFLFWNWSISQFNFFPHFPYQCRFALVLLMRRGMRVWMISIGNMRSIDIYFMVLSYRFLFNFIPHLFCFLFAASHSPPTYTHSICILRCISFGSWFIEWNIYYHLPNDGCERRLHFEFSSCRRPVHNKMGSIMIVINSLGIW